MALVAINWMVELQSMMETKRLPLKLRYRWRTKIAEHSVSSSLQVETSWTYDLDTMCQ